MTTLLLAKPVRSKEIEKLKVRVQSLKNKNITPSMKVILVGENPASVIYTSNKKKFIEKIGGICEIIRIEQNINELDFINEIKKIVSDESTHGCFVQLPLPKQLNSINIGSLIPPEKDVDGFSSKNLINLLENSNLDDTMIPCTPKGIITLLNHYQIDIEAKNVVIIGRSMIVGRPMALLLTNLNATVTICHSKTKNLNEITKRADIIISAVGAPFYLDEHYVNNQNNQVVIDVGINRDDAGNICGDVNFNAIQDKVAAITPVPGGVGPMTVLSLAQNLLQAAEKNI